MDWWAFSRALIPREPEFWVSLFIVILSSATLLAYKKLDKHQAARRYYTRKDRTQLKIGVMTACLVILSASAAFSTRYVINACVTQVSNALLSYDKRPRT